jgi:hypothetical protein
MKIFFFLSLKFSVLNAVETSTGGLDNTTAVIADVCERYRLLIVPVVVKQTPPNTDQCSQLLSG